MFDALQVLLTITAATLIFLTYLGTFRNKRVFEYRGKVLSKISHKAQLQISEGQFDIWRDNYKVLDNTSYNEMVWKFWKPVDSFFPEEYRGL